MSLATPTPRPPSLSLFLSRVRASARVSLSAFASTLQCQNEEMQAAFFLAGYIDSQKSVLKIKSAKINSFLRFLIAIIRPYLKKNI
jgi:hypothetical protein